MAINKGLLQNKQEKSILGNKMRESFSEKDIFKLILKEVSHKNNIRMGKEHL